MVILGLGAAGVYRMLPRGQPDDRRFQRYVGAALATLSLVFLVTVPVSARFEDAIGWPSILWPVDDQHRFTNFTFYLLGFVSLASAVLMITRRNPVYSALWFALVLLGNSGLYFLQQAEFLSTATIIVYAGAIVVTFLFVIMLAQPKGTAGSSRHSQEPFVLRATGPVPSSVLLGGTHSPTRLCGFGVGWAPPAAAATPQAVIR